MKAYLLDVNVLVALCDPRHVGHELAHAWFERKGAKAWATCPITENGFIRVASHPSYPNRPGDVRAVAGILAEMCSRPGHHFWPDDAHLWDFLAPDTVLATSHLTDTYLLGLACKAGGKLATLDRRIPVAAVQGGEDALEIVA